MLSRELVASPYDSGLVSAFGRLNTCWSADLFQVRESSRNVSEFMTEYASAVDEMESAGASAFRGS